MAGVTHLLASLQPLRGARTVILGVGNTLKGDDGVGPVVCELLAGNVSAVVMDAGTVPENYIARIAKARPENLLVIDAVDFGAAHGAIRLLDPDEIASGAFSTHALSPHLFLDLLRREVEVEVRLLGVQPATTRFGAPLSEPVQHAVETLVDLLGRIFPPAADRSNR